MKKDAKRAASAASPVTQLESELGALLRDLRRTVRAYQLRLESDLRESLDALGRFGPVEGLSRENLHTVRNMTMLLRKRKLKPEKGRRKDLRKIDSLIEDLQLFMQKSGGRANP